jgi:hypothetical protein
MIDLKELFQPIALKNTFQQMLKIIRFFMLPCKYCLLHFFQLFTNAYKSMFLQFLACFQLCNYVVRFIAIVLHNQGFKSYLNCEHHEFFMCFFLCYWSKPLYKLYGLKESLINIDLILYELVDLKFFLTPIAWKYTFLRMLKIVMFFMLPCKCPLFHSSQIFVNVIFL